MSTLKTINIIHPSGSTNNIVSDASGNVTVGNNITVTGTGSVSGNMSFNSGYGSSAVAYGCRAWVSFDATASPPTLRANGNVSSVTKNATGDFTVNFTNAMPDANYSFTGGVMKFDTTNDGNFTIQVGGYSGAGPTTTSVRCYTRIISGGAQNSAYTSVAVFR